MGFALWVLEPTQNGPGGEVRSSCATRAATRVRGLRAGSRTRCPRRSSACARGLRSAARRRADLGLRAGALDAWCRLLEEFGTRRLDDVIAPARALAERGFPMYPFLRALIELVAAALRALVADERGDLPAAARGRRAADQRAARALARLAMRSGARGGWLARGGNPRRARFRFYRGARRRGDRTLRAQSRCATSPGANTRA